MGLFSSGRRGRTFDEVDIRGGHGKNYSRGRARSCVVCGRQVRSSLGDVCSRPACHRTAARGMSS